MMCSGGPVCRGCWCIVLFWERGLEDEAERVAAVLLAEDAVQQAKGQAGHGNANVRQQAVARHCKMVEEREGERCELRWKRYVR